jgi:hypothetical protein
MSLRCRREQKSLESRFTAGSGVLWPASMPVLALSTKSVTVCAEKFPGVSRNHRVLSKAFLKPTMDSIGFDIYRSCAPLSL